MKKHILLSFLALMFCVTSAMEQEPSSHWQRLPTEMVIAKALPKKGTLEDILNNLTELGKNPLFSNLVHDETFCTYLIKEYVAHHQKTINNEFLQAVCHNKTSVVQALLSAGIDVNTQDECCCHTALMQAALNGHAEIVGILIRAGANVNTHDSCGSTVLMAATCKDYKENNEIIKMLIDAGANVNAQDDNGWTALMEAAERGHTEIVKTLIKAGSDVNIHGSYYPPITYATNNRHQEIVRILIDAGAAVNGAALNAAALNRDKAIVKMLIDAGADVNTTDEFGMPILALAQQKGYYKIARILKAAGASYKRK